MTLLPVVLSSLLLATNSFSTQKTVFAPTSLSAFDGSQWSSLAIGTTTEAEIKAKYELEKGAIRPEAVRFAGQKDGLRVEALLGDRGSKATVSAIRIQYSAPGELSSIAREIGDQPVFFYQAHRQEDWKLAVFSNKGIVAVVQNSDQVPFLYLVGPKKISKLVREFSETEVPVVIPKDPFVGKPKVAIFGSVSVTYDVADIGIKDQDKDQEAWEVLLKNLNAKGSAKYVEGEGGTASVTIRTKYDRNRGGNITIAAKLVGTTHYGNVTVTESRTESLPASNTPTSAANLELQSSIAYTKAMIALKSAFDSAIELEVARTGPPPISALRLQAWDQLLVAAGRGVYVVSENFKYGAVSIEFKDPRLRKSAAKAKELEAMILSRVTSADIPGLAYEQGVPGRVLVSLQAVKESDRLVPSISIRIEATTPEKSVRSESREKLDALEGDSATQEFLLDRAWLVGFDSLLDIAAESFAKEASSGKFGKPITQSSAATPATGPFVFGTIVFTLDGDGVDENLRNYEEKIIIPRIENIEDPTKDRYAVIGVGLTRVLERYKGELKYVKDAAGSFNFKVNVSRKGDTYEVSWDCKIEATRDGKVLKVSDRSKEKFDLDGRPNTYLVRTNSILQSGITWMCGLFDRKLAER